MAALVSSDAGAAPSLLPLDQPPLIMQVAGGCGLGWHRGHGVAAGAIGAHAVFSGQRLGDHAAFAVGKALPNLEQPAARVSFYSCRCRCRYALK
jgi:hypothetical protein